ncbi:FAD-binding oxidoreductase [Streptomyces albofaciens JCM 4342]|uniref:FAD-binding oxidoreductase n=1 Tax=Streptomyces albofaciens TaxID=66866 RepID=UPI00123B24B8|nr:FAD-binding protein [Streptomyces albofaciens]KAA6214527.1 FAD-binding oxidoreductase [Streptomyces albofaciens JCM 4342]
MNLTNDTTVPAASPTLAELAAQVTGVVLVPGDEGYDAERSGYQIGYSHRPSVIVGAASAADAVAAVRYARAHGLPVSVQSTGHGLAAATDGGLLISTRRMDGIRIDAAARTAWAGAGVLCGQLIEEAAPYGLAPVNGSSPGVGVVGYGGLGILGREFGYASDHVRTVELVTADGEVRRVSEAHEPDLFRALLGGGHGLGVVTGLESGLVPVERVYGGQLIFGADLLDEALAAYLAWTEDLPDALTSSVGLIVYPDAPAVPPHLRGRHLAQIRIAYTGTAEEGDRLAAPLRAVGPRVADTLREMPYTDSHTIHQDPATPHAYDGDSVLLSGLEADALRTVAALTGPDAPMMTVVQLNHLGGALAAGGGSVGHRDARYLLRLLSPLDGTDVAAVRALHAEVREALAPWAVGRAVNFLFGDHGDAVADAYEEPLRRRLAGAKAAYDPENVFRA